MENRNSSIKASPKSSDRSSFTHKLGDAVERVGKKLQDMGAKKTGQAVYRAGNKLEHSRDNKRK